VIGAVVGFDQTEPLSDNERAVVDHRGGAEELGYALAPEEALVCPAPFGGVRVASARAYSSSTALIWTTRTSVSSITAAGCPAESSTEKRWPGSGTVSAACSRI
jgi:hypothetical protein